MIGNNVKYYSWVDVHDQMMVLSENDRWLNELRVEVYQSGVYLFYPKSLTIDKIQDWLRLQFPNAIIEDKFQLELLQNGSRTLPIIFEELEEDDEYSPPFIPSFSRPRVLSSLADYREIPRPENKEPVIISTHSFKGGVGRTLHALALATAIEKKHQEKVLVIDADFEAPGITWMMTNPEISFVDIINIVHSSREPDKQALGIARKIENQQRGNIYFLPAFRTDRQLRGMEIKPEHIYRFSENPYFLTDFVVKVAKELNVDYVIIDLRAGISELSSSWLLDSRVSNVLVTTLSSQSLTGTITLMELLKEYYNDYKIPLVSLPTLIISQIPQNQIEIVRQIWGTGERNGDFLSDSINKLRASFQDWVTINTDSEEDTILDMSVIFSPIYDSLIVLPNEWKEIQGLIERSGLMDNVMGILELFDSKVPSKSIPENDIVEARNKMLAIVPDLIHAEKTRSNEFYKSVAIRNLANRHQTAIPNLVMIGSKGAGKTFLFRQLEGLKEWNVFLKSAADGPLKQTDVNAQIIPVTFPDNIIESEIWVKDIRPFILQKLEENNNSISWRNYWLDVIAWSAGYKALEKGAGESFLTELTKEGRKIIAIFDGLEDLFSNYHSSLAEQTAIKSLIVETVSYLGVTPNSPLGIIVFIRKDIVRQVITQNTAQFEERYKDYELEWNRNEVLKLVAWILIYHQIIKLPNIEDYKNIHLLNENILIEALYVLWGRKLGKDSSREGRSANSILTFLSNVNEEVQSRDIVRFLAQAIKEEQNTLPSLSDSKFKDRILSPRSIRAAIPFVGEEKIKEVKEENRNNKIPDLLNKLKNHQADIKIPFQATKVLDNNEITTLIDFGILYLSGGKYYMPEIYRTGLGLKMERARPRGSYS
jgi:MinD-like ATPase involved in chromosome partitioning or flagellar assembly